ncbi:hypothetical protein Tsubulata_016568 [Turnera subulata]|uniref:Flowering time control protein FCA n=1 Tax=Turnera subulata TaxID=218843 RepID=A0A9Q0FDA8_9ROSI|nr:hypothetical protein Tsubulata_016568 [Turnera subulata]
MERYDRADHQNYHEQQQHPPSYQHSHHFHPHHHHHQPPLLPTPQLPPAPPQQQQQQYPPPPQQQQQYPPQHQHFHQYPPPPNQNNQFIDQQNHEPYYNHHQNDDFYPNHTHHNHQHQHQQMAGEPIEPLGGGGGGGGGFRSGVRKRDYNDGTAKLYVAPVRNATEEDIRHLFQKHGSIVEVVFPKEKYTGQRQGYCFVKYASLEEAERAIRALNGQHIPGEMATMKVRYADGERERLGGFVDKLYVGCINKLASREELEEIFTPYGHVEDIFIARDEMKQCRGFAFVKFSQRDMALAAIKALHGNFTMRDCDQPLIVRFADPKKPRTGESRGNYGCGGTNFGPGSQEPIARPVPNFADCIGGFPNASYSSQHDSTNSQLQDAVSYLKQEPTAPHGTAPPLALVKQTPSMSSSMPVKHPQALEDCSRSSQQGASEMQKKTQNLEQQWVMQIPLQETSSSGGNPQVASSIAAASAGPISPQRVDADECDWSEHSCPDGYKYYYNCVTCESRWDKPEEFSTSQQSLQKRQKPPNGNQQCHSFLPVFSSEEVDKKQKDMDPVQIHSEKSQFVVPACVPVAVSDIYSCIRVKK